MHKINFYDNKGQRYEYCEFYILKNETFFDKLEEVLYIMCEITPTHRNWKRDLATDNVCLFDYHRVQTVRVEYIWNTYEINCYDI